MHFTFLRAICKSSSCHHILLWVFILNFHLNFCIPNDYLEHFFMCFCATCIPSLGKYLLESSVPTLLLDCLGFLKIIVYEIFFYILDTDTLSNIYTANIFSQSVDCIFIILTVSFKEQKFLFLMKSIFFLLWWMLFVSSLYNLKSQKFFPVLF